jgi:hypothetical protein
MKRCLHLLGHPPSDRSERPKSVYSFFNLGFIDFVCIRLAWLRKNQILAVTKRPFF